jgi:DNA-directed RNA polymerase sigma subunit (sigma70/sigma32)
MKTLSEIGRALGMSRQRVRQLELRAMAKLRKATAGAADFEAWRARLGVAFQELDARERLIADARHLLVRLADEHDDGI